MAKGRLDLLHARGLRRPTRDGGTSMSLAPSASGTFASSLAESRAYCASLTKQQARNFYYGLKLLPRPKRAAMFALYAYMRLVDDIADKEDGRAIALRAVELEAWRQQTQAVLRGELPEQQDGGVWPAFAEMV